MKLSLCFSATSTTTILAVLVNFSLAAETAKLHQNDVNSTHHLEKGVQKASGYYCNALSDCRQYLGTWSSCNSNQRCVCDMGYEVRPGSMYCQKVSCSWATDCTGKFGLFSHCSLSSCSCDYNYSYDLQLETCSRSSSYDYYYYHSGPNFGLIIGLPVTIIGLIIISVAIVMVRRRRQQELAAAAAARVVAMQRGAVVQQQPTVIINHQQNPQHPQHPVYYQPQQNPPPFNPTFTGYQPQPAPPQYQPPQYQPPAPAPGVYPSVSSSSGQYPNLAQTHYKS